MFQLARGEQAIDAVLTRCGWRLRRISRQLPAEPSMEGALYRARQRQTTISTVVDIGASNGRWSALAMKHFPDAQYLLVEAQPAYRGSLDRFTKRHRNTRYALAAAGDHDGTVHFEVASDLSGGRAASTPIPGSIEVPLSTVDSLVATHRLYPPYCIKLDTHGFELPILAGAHKTLQETCLLIMECYSFDFAENLRFHQMCAYMENLGFRCVDLVDPLYRPGDRALWQMDLFFIRESEPLFANRHF